MRHIHHLQFEVKRPFGNLLRPRCVLIAAQDDQGNILVGAKPDFYPPTITRLLGGGVDDNESFEQAAQRELAEELGVELKAEAFTGLALFDTAARDEAGQTYHNETAVFIAQLGTLSYQAGDDVASIIPLTPAELYALGEGYEQLSDTLWYNGQEGLYAWADYAKLYGPIHKLVAKQLKSSPRS